METNVLAATAPGDPAQACRIHGRTSNENCRRGKRMGHSPTDRGNGRIAIPKGQEHEHRFLSALQRRLPGRRQNQLPQTDTPCSWGPPLAAVGQVRCSCRTAAQWFRARCVRRSVSPVPREKRHLRELGVLRAFCVCGTCWPGRTGQPSRQLFSIGSVQCHSCRRSQNASDNVDKLPPFGTARVQSALALGRQAVYSSPGPAPAVRLRFPDRLDFTCRFEPVQCRIQ